MFLSYVNRAETEESKMKTGCFELVHYGLDHKCSFVECSLNEVLL